MIFAFNHIIIIIITIIIHLAIISFNKIIRFMSLHLTLFQLFYGFFLNIKFIFFFHAYCRYKGPGLYIRPWALVEDVVGSEDE